MKIQTFVQTLAALALLGPACSSDEGESGENGNCDGGKCDDDDEIRASPCDGKMHDKAGRGLGTGKIAGGLGDPIAQIAFQGDSCPTNFSDIVTKLIDSGKCEEHKTAMISEDAQLLAQPGSYRAVTSMDCETDDGGIGSVWFSAFGIRAAATVENTPIPTSVELMSFDPAEGVFNYYETKGSSIEFFGDSKQFITEGTGSNGDARCAGCHTGGGLIMKELATPWLHWTGDFVTPGHSEIIGANESLLGRESDGIELEDQVITGNDEWNDSRLEFMRSSVGTTTTLADLLRPVFCAVEVNLESEFGESFGGTLFGAVVDSDVSSFNTIDWENEDYKAMIAANGQRMRVGNETDTVGELTRIVRGDADINYTRKLISAGIVDAEFVSDVRLIDFTRSIFSEDRCELLRFAPDLTADDLNVEKIREGFVQNLEAEGAAEGTPVADLLRNLQAEENVRATVETFERACTSREGTTSLDGRDVRNVAIDYMAYISHVRSIAERLPVFEFDGATMPQDALNTADGTRLDPVTCEISTRYTSVEPIEGEDNNGGVDSEGGFGGGEDIPATCEDRCGDEFVEGAPCQCDEACLENDDCCEDIGDFCEDIGAGGEGQDISCEFRGCGDFTEGAECQCDDGCVEFGNCCDDFAGLCDLEDAVSCAARGCDDFVDGAECQCDANCFQFDNCCADHGAVCGVG